MDSLGRVFLAAIMAFTYCGASVAQEGAVPDKRIGILLAAGDIAACFHKNRKYKEVANLIQAEIDKANGLPVGVLVLGDIAYSNRNTKGKMVAPFYADCVKEFDATWGKFYDRLFPVAGNHDYTDDPTGTVYKDYFKGRLQELKADSTQFYATTFPRDHANAWLLAAVNYYRDATKQQGFLRTALADSKAVCILVFSHPFLSSSGNHGRSQLKKIGGKLVWSDAEMAPFMKIAIEQGASLLVTAHDHDYERFARRDVDGKEVADGLASFVVGTGGAKLYPMPDSKRHPLSRNSQDTSAGLLKLELYADHYTSSFLNIDGTVFDVQSDPQDCSKRPS